MSDVDVRRVSLTIEVSVPFAEIHDRHVAWLGTDPMRTLRLRKRYRELGEEKGGRWTLDHEAGVSRRAGDGAGAPMPEATLDVFGEDRDARIWLSDDERGLIVRVGSTTRVGPLQSHTCGRTPPASSRGVRARLPSAGGEVCDSRTYIDLNRETCPLQWRDSHVTRGRYDDALIVQRTAGHSSRS